MGFNFRKFFAGLNIVPRSDGATAPTKQGDLAVSSADGNLYYNNGSGISAINTNSSSSTLTNKTIPVGSNHITSTVNTAAQFNASTGDLESSVTTDTELAFVHGVTSNIQTQINAISGSGITSLTGDVTGIGPGATATTISTNVVSNAKLAQMPTLTIKGNNTGGTANASDLTVAQVNAILPVFSSSLNGLVPASGGGTTNFLRADGTFSPPSGSLTVGTLDGTAPSANAAVITGGSLFMQSASATEPGIINTTSQTIAGTKTFSGAIVAQQIDGNDSLLIQSSNAGVLTLQSQITGQITITAPNGAAVQQITTPSSNPSAGYTKIYPKADNNFYSLDSSGNEKLIGGSGGGALNFVGSVNTNDINFESTIGNWAAFADSSPGSVPTSGLTGGSPSVTITRTTTAGQVLDGVGSGLITKGASNLQGQGVSVMASIPLGYRGQSASISIPYKVVSGSISSGDLNVFIWDVTNNALVTPGNNGVLGTSGIVQANFTIPATCAQLRLGFFFSTTSATAVTLSFDDVNINPSTIVLSAAMSDFQSYTPTFTGFGTVSGSNFQYRRVGSNVEIMGFFTAGTPTAVQAQITLPLGLSTSSSITSKQIYGYGGNNQAETSLYAILESPSVGYMLFGFPDVAGGLGTFINGNDTVSTGNTFTLNASIPIQGWSSNVINGVVPGMSGSDWKNDLSFVPSAGFGTTTSSSYFYRRVGDSMHVRGWFTMGTVAASTASLALPSGYLIDSSKLAAQTVKLGDAHLLGGTNNPLYSSGVGNVSFYDGSDTTNIYFGYLESTGTYNKFNVSTPFTNGQSFNFDFVIPIAGWSVNNGNNTPTPSARYFASSTSISGSLSTITYSTLDYDNNSAYSGGVYTVPQSGKYQINAALLITGTIALNSTIIMEIQKNGSVVSRTTEFSGGASTDLKVTISDIINCALNDTVRIQVSTSVTGPSIVSSNFDNNLSLCKIG